MLPTLLRLAAAAALLARPAAAAPGCAPASFPGPILGDQFGNRAPRTVRVGAQFPLFKAGTFTPDAGGRRRLAAFLLALQHVNDKHDGFFDDVLPNTTLAFAVRDSRRDSGEAVVNAFKLWDEFAAAVHVGPASSGPTRDAQAVLKLKEVGVPQISYSATSATLSAAVTYPLFLRTPPSDAIQAEAMVSLVEQQGWTRVCVLAGLDAYSSAGGEDVARLVAASSAGMSVLTHATFVPGSGDVAQAIAQLRRSQCPLVMLWAQATDLRAVIAEADRQGLAADHEARPVLWVISETVLGSCEDVCRDQPEACRSVIRGALALTPSYGPGSSSYARLADAWHAQASSSSSSSLAAAAAAAAGGNCDARRDSLREFIWNRDHDGDPHTDPVCASVNFSDYSRDEADAHAPESVGDGRISTYVPYAYDATMAVAVGLHLLFTSDTGDWPSWDEIAAADACDALKLQTRNQSLLCPAPKEEALTPENIYKHMLRASFDGFSGKVQFHCNASVSCADLPSAPGPFPLQPRQGDRDATAIDTFVWNYDGVAFSKIGSMKIGGGRAAGPGEPAAFARHQLTGVAQTGPVVWPSRDNTAHDEANWVALAALEPPERPRVVLLAHTMGAAGTSSLLNVSWTCTAAAADTAQPMRSCSRDAASFTLLVSTTPDFAPAATDEYPTNGRAFWSRVTVPVDIRRSLVYAKVKSVGAGGEDEGGASEFSRISQPWMHTLEAGDLGRACGETTLYLDTAREPADPTAWDCRPCPPGGSCAGSLLLADLDNLFGWWPIPPAERAGADDIFARCLYPPACPGAPNPALVDLHGDAALAGRPAAATGTNMSSASRCAPGYRNDSRLCHACDTGWARDGESRCVACAEEGTKNLVLFVGGAVLLFGAYCGMVWMHLRAFVTFDSAQRKKSQHATLKRIIVSHAQTISLVLGLNVPYPREVVDSLETAYSWTANLGSSNVNSMSCLWSAERRVSGSVFYFQSLVGFALFPLGFAAVLAFKFYVADKALLASGTTRHGPLCNSHKTSGEGLNRTRSRRRTSVQSALHRVSLWSSSSAAYRRKSEQVVIRGFVASDADRLVYSLLLLWFLLLPTLLRIGVTSFHCTAVGQSDFRWLIVDLETRCGSGPQLAYAVGVALPMLVGYGVLVPVGALVVLRSYGGMRLTDPSVMFRWGLLHSGYREQKFWWELVVLARKYTLILLATVATDDIYQLWAGLAVFVVAMHLHDTQRPYGGSHASSKHLHHHNQQQHAKAEAAKRMLHQYENWSLIILLFLLWTGMFFMLNVCQGSTRAWCTLLVVCVLSSNVLYILATVGRCCREFYKKNQRNLSGVVKAVKDVAKKGRASALGGGAKGPDSRPESLPDLPAVAIVNVKSPPPTGGDVEMVMTHPQQERRNTSVTL